MIVIHPGSGLDRVRPRLGFTQGRWVRVDDGWWKFEPLDAASNPLSFAVNPLAAVAAAVLNDRVGIPFTPNVPLHGPSTPSHSPQAAGHSRAPLGYTKQPVGHTRTAPTFTRVSRDQESPW